MSKKKLVFKKSGAEKRIERFESNIQFAQVSDTSFDAAILRDTIHDEMEPWPNPGYDAATKMFTNKDAFNGFGQP